MRKHHNIFSAICITCLICTLAGCGTVSPKSTASKSEPAVTAPASSTSAATVSASASPADSSAAPADASDAGASASQPDSAAADPNATQEQINALIQAKSYSDNMHMSKQGIHDQLTSEYGGQFSEEDATYALDHLNADWNANGDVRSLSQTRQPMPSAAWTHMRGTALRRSRRPPPSPRPGSHPATLPPHTRCRHGRRCSTHTGCRVR